MTYQEQYDAYLNAAQTRLEQDAKALFNANSTVAKAAQYSLFAGGKRVRAVLCMAACDMLNGDMQQAAGFAAAVEMLHCYSLIHDDLPCMDNDDYRRGRLSCHKAFDETTALLAGDALLTAAFETVATAKGSAEAGLRAVKVLSAGAGTNGMVYGQELDIRFEGLPIEQKQLEQVHHYKTGCLIDAAVRMGAAAANADEQTEKAVSAYAFDIGLVFQIVDDILDVTADEAQLGKPVGSDGKNGKVTYVTLLDIQKAQQQAEKITQAACVALQTAFGEKAEFLVQLASQLLTRKK